MSIGRFELEVVDEDAENNPIAYLRLPTHSGMTTKMSKSVRLVDLMGKYDGPDIVLDFDEHGKLVGIEIIT